MPSLIVLPWDWRLWLESHSLTVRHKIVTAKWYLESFLPLQSLKDIFVLLQKKNNSYCSLAILSIQIREFYVNNWLALASLPFIGWWFHSLVFRLVIFIMYQKEEFAFCFIAQSKKFIKERFINIKQKKPGVKITYLGFIGFCEKHFLKDSFVF